LVNTGDFKNIFDFQRKIKQVKLDKDGKAIPGKEVYRTVTMEKTKINDLYKDKITKDETRASYKEETAWIQNYRVLLSNTGVSGAKFVFVVVNDESVIPQISGAGQRIGTYPERNYNRGRAYYHLNLCFYLDAMLGVRGPSAVNFRMQKKYAIDRDQLEKILYLLVESMYGYMPMTIYNATTNQPMMGTEHWDNTNPECDWKIRSLMSAMKHFPGYSDLHKRPKGMLIGELGMSNPAVDLLTQYGVYYNSYIIPEFVRNPGKMNMTSLTFCRLLCSISDMVSREIGLTWKNDDQSITYNLLALKDRMIAKFMSVIFGVTVNGIDEVDLDEEELQYWPEIPFDNVIMVMLPTDHLKYYMRISDISSINIFKFYNMAAIEGTKLTKVRGTVGLGFKESFTEEAVTIPVCMKLVGRLLGQMVSDETSFRFYNSDREQITTGFFKSGTNVVSINGYVPKPFYVDSLPMYDYNQGLLSQNIVATDNVRYADVLTREGLIYMKDICQPDVGEKTYRYKDSYASKLSNLRNSLF
jgi:hypothetical protein